MGQADAAKAHGFNEFLHPKPELRPGAMAKARTDRMQGRNREFDRQCRDAGLPHPVHDYRLKGGTVPYLFDGWLALLIEGPGYVTTRAFRNDLAAEEFVAVYCTEEELADGSAVKLVKRIMGVVTCP